MSNVNRSIRVLVVAREVKGKPVVRDRHFVRRNRAETTEFYEGLQVLHGEKAFLQRYTKDVGWMTVRAKGDYASVSAAV